MKVGKEISCRPVANKTIKHHISSENGRSLIDFTLGKNMIVFSTKFPPKEIHKETWTSFKGNILELDRPHSYK